MMKLFQNPILFFCICLLAGCKEEYYPKIKASEQSVLVVEGVLSSGPDSTKINLSRAVKLNDSAAVQPETGAHLTVEGKSGSLAELVETGDGKYGAASLSLQSGDEYRLHIYTAAGNEYASDYVAIQPNPPIDSVNWRQDTSGVTIFVNTHNPQNNTRYYRWEFEETWQIRSAYFASYPVDDGLNEPIYPGESLYFCWKNHNSSNLILGTTTQLSSDVVFEKPIIKIPDGDDRLSEKYTVLVRQYALDKQGYAFYQLMKKNTESLGSIFDAQPTEITGNVHALSNTTQPVIGYITASTINTSRIWITRDELSHWKPWADCSQTKEINTHTDNIENYIHGDWLPFAADMNGNVYLARRECISCRLRGGSTHKPVWWP